MAFLLHLPEDSSREQIVSVCVHPPPHPTLFVEINMEIRLSKTAKPAKLK